ncbi:formin-binding protein 1-like isoform X2 [Syngnathus acus]|uniref:formin-binding protein 1-like isoform X2 n=1 Tax=Syngnathus acus TaxID=161584 RepID=UPI001885D96B|nr:formin-binding protein 1-like isoform X2 [Syngnathus acus]
MSVNWGAELWDQFDNLEKHTSWGIDFLEKYTKFVKERADIELNYAKQMRSLSKKYLPKRSREDDGRYTWCAAFGATLAQLAELAAQREEVADRLGSHVAADLGRFTQELKAERKSHFQDGRRAQQHIENSWKQLESAKRRFERDSKEAERARHTCDRMDADDDVDAEKRCSLKARQAAQQKQLTARESEKEYLNALSQFNRDQHQHYRTMVPVIYQRIQEMEERRIERVGAAMRSSAEAEKKSLPVVSRCLDAMMEAAQSIHARTDTLAVVHAYKSGFEPPGDVDVEEHAAAAAMRRSVSESSYLDGHVEGRRRGRKLWPFLRRNKLLNLLPSPRQPPPPPPASPSPGGAAGSPQSPPPAAREPIARRLNDLMTSGSRSRKQCLRSIKRGVGPTNFTLAYARKHACKTHFQKEGGKKTTTFERQRGIFQQSFTFRAHMKAFDGLPNSKCPSFNAPFGQLSLKLGSSPADCSHLPVEQRRNKLQNRIRRIGQEILREREQREALVKMKAVYNQNPTLGDGAALEPRLDEVRQSLHSLEEELRNNQAWLAEAEQGVSARLPPDPTCTPGTGKRMEATGPDSRESPDGSYTEEPGAELHFSKSRSSDFDDDFDDEPPPPSIGTCKSLYPFRGQNEGTLSMGEGELLSVVEEDKGDGWTRVRRNADEEGYVPTSYIKVFIEAKGFVQAGRLV